MNEENRTTPENGTLDLHFRTLDIMRLAETAGSFAFWLEPGEDVYTGNDGEPLQ